MQLESDRRRGDRLQKEALEARQQVDALKKLVDYDELTGLPNRRAFQEEIKRQYAEVQRSLHPLQEAAGQEFDCSILVIDLDGFGDVNKRFGHAAGDVCLREVARRVRELLRPLDLLARMGGDEFMLILPNTNAVEAQPVAERVYAAIHDSVTNEMRQQYKSEDPEVPPLQISASIGIVSFQQERATDGTLPSADELVKRADYASRVVKASGKDGILSLSDAKAIDDRGQIRADILGGKN